MTDKIKDFLLKIWKYYAIALVLSSVIWTARIAYYAVTATPHTIDLFDNITKYIWGSFFTLLCLATVIATIWCVDYFIKDFFGKK